MTRNLALTFDAGRRLLLISPRDLATRAWLGYDVVHYEAAVARAFAYDLLRIKFALTDLAMREAAAILEGELRQSFPEEDVRVRAFALRPTIYELVEL